MCANVPEEPWESNVQQRGHGNTGMLFRTSCTLCNGDHAEGACQYTSHASAESNAPSKSTHGKGKKSKKGKGKGRDSQDEAESEKPSVVALKCFDFVDQSWLHEVGAMRLSAYLDPRFYDQRFPESKFVADQIPQQSTTLRNTCFQLTERFKHSKGRGVEAWFKEDKLPQAAGVQGRLWGGTQVDLMTEEEILHFAGMKYVNGYNATRPLFTYRKEVKELLRGGKECGDLVRDYDRKTSFPAAFLSRHPWASWVRKWTTGELMRLMLDICPDIKRGAVKEFINCSFGVGQKGMDAWCKKYGLTILPHPLEQYHLDIKKGSLVDMQNNPELVDKLKEATKRTGQDLVNALVYVLNSAYERQSLDTAILNLKNHALLRCNELDGIFIERLAKATWKEIEGILGPDFVYKPYRTRAELLQICAQEVPGGESLLQIRDGGWYNVAKKAAECAHRLQEDSRNAPVIWLGEILDGLRVDDVLFRDRYKTSPCSGKSLDVYKCVSHGKGCLWEASKGDVDVFMEADIVKVLCGMMGLRSELEAPNELVGGSLTRSICTRLSQPLYDPIFLTKLDGEKNNGLIAFGCGTVVNMLTGEVRGARADDFIQRHVSYAYPREELSEIVELQKQLGFSLDDVLKDVNTWEMFPLNKGKDVYSESIRDRLNTLVTQVPHFAFFELMHNSFTPNYNEEECPTPESYGGWQSTVFRTMKVPAAALSSAHENNVFDLGEEGDNGKGVLAYALSVVYDGYYEDLPLGLLKEDPPSGGKVSPEVWQLKGAHFLGTPESEKSITIKTIWLKQLADQSTVWKARGLYKDTQAFRIPALWAMSSNLRVNLTSIDGGVRRRLRGVKWPVAFKRVPEGPFQRERSDDSLKQAEYYSPRIRAGVLYATLAAYNAFFKEKGSVGLEVMPEVVLRATHLLIVQEYGEYIEEFLNTETTESVGKEGSTKLQVLAALRRFIQPLLPMGENIDPKALDSSLDSHCVTKVPWGTVERLYRVSSKKYVKLKVSDIKF